MRCMKSFLSGCMQTGGQPDTMYARLSLLRRDDGMALKAPNRTCQRMPGGAHSCDQTCRYARPWRVTVILVTRSSEAGGCRHLRSWCQPFFALNGPSGKSMRLPANARFPPAAHPSGASDVPRQTGAGAHSSTPWPVSPPCRHRPTSQTASPSAPGTAAPSTTVRSG